jgi:hypothetical protein
VALFQRKTEDSIGHTQNVPQINKKQKTEAIKTFQCCCHDIFGRVLQRNCWIFALIWMEE